MARNTSSQPSPKRPNKDAASHKQRLSKLVSFVKALKKSAASMAKKPAPSPAKKMPNAPAGGAFKKPISKKSVVKKPARKPVMKAQPRSGAYLSKEPPAAGPVPLVSVVKKPARGPIRRVSAKRAVERRRSPRKAPSASAPSKETPFPIRPFEVSPQAPPRTQETVANQRIGQNMQEPAFSIPTGYGDNRIVLMVKDPWWLYAYWEIQPAVERSARAQLLPNEVAGLQTVLRVYDVTGRRYPDQPAHRFFDISLSGMAVNWYIKTDAPGRSFVVEIGLLTNTGRFLLLARSNMVTPPRYGPSDVIDEEWATTDEDYWKLFGAASGVGSGSSQSGSGINLSSSAWSSTNLYGLDKSSRIKGFWCRVNADLVIHGTTEPRSTVSIQGQPVAVRKDGTFSLRLALPEEAQTISIEVISADGKKTRTITPVVSMGLSAAMGGGNPSASTAPKPQESR